MRVNSSLNDAVIVLNSNLFESLQNLNRFAESLNRNGFLKVAIIENQRKLSPTEKAQFSKQMLFIKNDKRYKVVKEAIEKVAEENQIFFSEEELGKAAPYIASIDRIKRYFNVTDSEKVLLIEPLEYKQDFMMKFNKLNLFEVLVHFSNQEVLITEHTINEVAETIRDDFLKMNCNFFGNKEKDIPVKPIQPKPSDYCPPQVPYPQPINLPLPVQQFYPSSSPYSWCKTAGYSQPMVIPPHMPKSPFYIPQPAHYSMGLVPILPKPYVVDKAQESPTLAKQDEGKIFDIRMESSLLSIMGWYHTAYTEIYRKLVPHKDFKAKTAECKGYLSIYDIFKSIQEKAKMDKQVYTQDDCNTELKNFITKIYQTVCEVSYRLDCYNNELNPGCLGELLYSIEKSLSYINSSIITLCDAIKNNKELSIFEIKSAGSEKRDGIDIPSQEKNKAEEVGGEKPDTEEVLEQGAVNRKRTWDEVIGIKKSPKTNKRHISEDADDKHCTRLNPIKNLNEKKIR